MKTVLTVPLVVLLALTATGAEPPAAPEPVAPANNAFAAGLCRELASQPGNLFFSPYSVSSALAMVREGARGETASQMDAVLHLPGPAGKDWKTLAASLAPGLVREGRGEEEKQVPAFALSIANAVWVQDGLAIEAPFAETLAQNYGAPAQRIDFRETEKARAAINRWVAEKTAEKIKDIVPAGLPTPDTLLALANAIHYKAAWAEPFDAKWTKEAPFTVTAEETVTAPFMLRTGSYAYTEGADAQVLEIPYRGGETSMVVILPKAKDGLPALSAALTERRLAEWIGKLQGERIAVSLPKFSFTWARDLREVLPGMGMKDAFLARKAEFTGITTAEPLYIGPVLHKAFVAVDEAGTEAAAATVVLMPRGMGRPSAPVAFVADHPFLFLIRHRATGTILFLGRVADPTK